VNCNHAGTAGRRVVKVARRVWARTTASAIATPKRADADCDPLPRRPLPTPILCPWIGQHLAPVKLRQSLPRATSSLWRWRGRRPRSARSLPWSPSHHQVLPLGRRACARTSAIAVGPDRRTSRGSSPAREVSKWYLGGSVAVYPARSIHRDTGLVRTPTTSA
jgi:hypothetical protein